MKIVSLVSAEDALNENKTRVDAGANARQVDGLLLYII